MTETIIMILCILGVIAAAVVLAAYITFRMTFYYPPKKRNDVYDIPTVDQYEKYSGAMRKMVDENLEMPYEEVWATSCDGLRLRGRYYHTADGAPVEIMFHGYKGTAERDMTGGLKRCLHFGRNALLVDQRSQGKSEGNVITFGIMERRDCLAWIDYINRRFGSDTPIMLLGISMGAATVLMTAGMEELPDNVVGVLADCGYTSPRDIICKVVADMHLPAVAYPFIKLGARIFGHFDLEESSALEAMKKCRVPVFFIHGEEDHFVPCEMTMRNHAACNSDKTLLVVPEAGHGLSFFVDYDGYMKLFVEFAEKVYGKGCCDIKDPAYDPAPALDTAE